MILHTNKWISAIAAGTTALMVALVLNGVLYPDSAIMAGAGLWTLGLLGMWYVLIRLGTQAGSQEFVEPFLVANMTLLHLAVYDVYRGENLQAAMFLVTAVGCLATAVFCAKSNEPFRDFFRAIPFLGVIFELY